jgi:hypothetical protein
MSTTFGVIVPEQDEPIEVARRTSSSTSKTGVNIRILNPLVVLLPDETLLEALDNSNQGIHTVKDLKWYLKEQE